MRRRSPPEEAIRFAPSSASHPSLLSVFRLLRESRRREMRCPLAPPTVGALVPPLEKDVSPIRRLSKVMEGGCEDKCVSEEVVSLIGAATNVGRRRSMRPLSCRRCAGHGIHILLKGHAPVCPFNTCSCAACSSVMSLRANALIRRFRHRKPDEPNALLKTIRSKNGNMRLRILPKSNSQSSEEDSVIGSVCYERGERGCLSSLSSRSSSTSPPAVSPTLPFTPSIPPMSAFLLPPIEAPMLGDAALQDYLSLLLRTRALQLLSELQSTRLF